MSRKKINRNDKCPCQSGKKYKDCCWHKVQWEDFLKSKDGNHIRYLSARGKNLRLTNVIAEALQLNKIKINSVREIKRACTPNAVKYIHEYIPYLWHDSADLYYSLESFKNDTSGLYIGHYEPELILRGITRHSLYSDKILLIDPFHDPRVMQPNFNPVEKPENFIESTLRAIRIWFKLYPWVEAGIINFIRSPCDFNYKLLKETNEKTEHRMKTHKELELALKENDIPEQYVREFKQYYFLSQSDDFIIKKYKEEKPNADKLDIVKYLEFVNIQREEHPFYVPFVNMEMQQTREPLITVSCGVNYEMSKIITAITNSHIITDIAYRWKEIQIDREENKIDLNKWSSFSKTFQKLPFTFLNDVPLDFALKIRKREHLSDIRNFLSRLWRQNKIEDDLDEKNISIIEEELTHYINSAEADWSNIKNDWIKYASANSFLTAFSIANGAAETLIGTAIGAIGTFLIDKNKRKNFTKKHPAGFFLKLKNKKM